MKNMYMDRAKAIEALTHCDVTMSPNDTANSKKCIVERLRIAAGKNPTWLEMNALLEEAADEIARLQSLGSTSRSND